MQVALDQKAAREKANEKLRKKGKLTKKQKYLAAKAAKKAQAQSEQKEHRFNLEEALAAAKLKKLDPKAVKCFMTGLPYLASEKHVCDHFSNVGPCSVQLFHDRSTGRSNGTGFVTFATAEEALEA